MQHPFSCIPATYDQIESRLSVARLTRYLSAADNDKHLALRYYVWNARICEALYLPLQLAEVSSRNAIAIPVQKRFADRWFTNSKFINLLPKRQRGTLENTIKNERKRRGEGLNQDHIIAALPFGFWVSLMTKSYENHLWANGVGNSFPNASRNENQQSIYKQLDKMRNFRNAVAHHYAIFDKGPQREYQNVLHITKMVCPETHWMSKEVSRVSSVINDRPKW